MKTFLILFFTFFAINIIKAQWQSTPGPYVASAYIGMDVRDIAINGNNLCAIINNEVFISNNNGISWMYASYGLQYAKSIAIKDSNIFVAAGAGIYISTNYGSTYKSITNNLPPTTSINDITLSGNAILVSIYTNSFITDVYYSTDNGTNWNPANGINNQNPTCLASDGQYVYAGTSQGVYMSSDNGINWVNIGLTNTSISVIAVKGNRLFASENLSSGGFYFSNNNGLNWTPISGMASPYVGSIALNDNFVYIKSGGLYRSNNNGLTWSSVGGSLSACGSINEIAVNGTNLYAGCSDNFAVSTNEGINWSFGLKTYNLNIKSIVSSGPNIVAATNNGIQLTSDNGTNWTRNLINYNTFTTNDSMVYAGTASGINISKDYGNNWSGQNISGFQSNSKINSIVVGDSILFAASLGTGVYFSRNKGYNWTQRINGLTSLNISCVTICDSIVIAGSSNKGIFVSSDYGLHWNIANTGLTDSCIQTIASYKNNIYAGTKSQGIFKSSDNGINWTQINSSLADTNILCLYTCGENVFAGVLGRGLLLSNDNGNNWHTYNAGLKNYNVKSITENNTNLFVGSMGSIIATGMSGGGVWKRPLSEFPLTFSIKKIKVSDWIICEGFSSTINVSVIGGTPPYTYLWENGEQTSSITVNPSTTATYNLSVTDNNSEIITTDITITVKPKPTKPVITQNNDTLVSSSNSDNVWLLNNHAIYNPNSNFLIPFYSGYYSVIIIHDGCVSDTSNIITVGINENFINKEVKIYPNPVTDKITIETIKYENKVTLIIYDISGKELIHQIINKNIECVDVSKLTSGIYFVKLIHDKAVIIKKILKE